MKLSHAGDDDDMVCGNSRQRLSQPVYVSPSREDRRRELAYGRLAPQTVWAVAMSNVPNGFVSRRSRPHDERSTTLGQDQVCTDSQVVCGSRRRCVVVVTVIQTIFVAAAMSSKDA